MSQVFCATRGMFEPYGLIAPGTVNTQVSVLSALTVIWPDGTTDAYAPSVFASSLYGGNVADGTAGVWILIAVKGHDVPYLGKEEDFDNFDVLVGIGVDWSVLRRLDNGMLYALPQV